MKDRWKKGEPVNLSDLLKITPVANEILRLRDEMDMSCSDIMWIVGEIVDENESLRESDFGSPYDVEDEDDVYDDDDWEEDGEDALESVEGAFCTIEIKVCSSGKFPEMGFRAGIRSREDLKPFLDMVMDMVDKFGG